MASSISSPAMRMEDLVTILPREMTATSLVPPPTSTTIDPWASLTGRLVPMAAARGSSMVNARRAPEHPLRRRPDGHDLIRLDVYCDHRGLREYDPLSFDEHYRVRRSKVYRNVSPEQSSEHTRPILRIERPRATSQAARLFRAPSY